MKKYWLLFVLPLLLLASSGLYADVILTDEQAAELDETLDELETISTEQQITIENLRKQNSELQSQLDELKQQSNVRTNLLDEQETTLKEAKSSYKKQNIFSILQNILIAIVSCAGGLLIGILVF